MAWTGFEFTTLVVIDCTGSCKSNYHTITTSTDLVCQLQNLNDVNTYCLIHYYLATRQKYFRKIQDENKLKNILKPCRNEVKISKQIKRLLTVTELMYEELNRDDVAVTNDVFSMLGACHSKHTTHYGPYCNLTTSYPTERDDDLIILLLLQMTSLACWERATLSTQPTTVRIVTWQPPTPPRGTTNWSLCCCYKWRL